MPANLKNYEWKAEVKTTPGTRAAVWLQPTIPAVGALEQNYEVTLSNTSEASAEGLTDKSGSLHGIRHVYKTAAQDDEWFQIRIVVQGKHLQTFINDVRTVDYTEPDILPQNISPVRIGQQKGTVALRCLHAEKATYFKNIFLRPLPEELLQSKPKPYFSPDKRAQVDRLIRQGFPLIDFHVHLKGGVSLQDVVDKSLQTGIFCGIAPNCGIGFPIDTNDKLEQFYAEHKNIPIFLAMQAEGREWVRTFQKESIAKFDYVFTDAMTFTDDNGKRMRLWIQEEVGEITDAHAFVEMYVRRILSVLNEEKIDIYVNPTFLPQVIASRYEELWTEARMGLVVDALVKNGIALEINARYKIPSAKFIRLAKSKGVKFAFGTNNTDKEFADLDYCLQIMKECDLQPSDMFFPKPAGQKPVQIR